MGSDPLYFAYGQNLNEADLRSWCQNRGYLYPLKEKVANAYLPDTRIVFNCFSPHLRGGALNITYHLGHVTPGVLFRVNTGGWETLDAKGEEENMYKHLNIIALTEDGCEHVATAYQIRTDKKKGDFFTPDRAYLQTLREGLKSHGFDDYILNTVAAGEEPPYLIAHLFVYGTLMRDEPRHPLLTKWADTSRRREAEAPGILYDSGKGFPCMVPDVTGRGRVKGEIYPIRDPKKAFETLDIYETARRYRETETFLRRAIVRTVTKEGESLLAWAYFAESSVDGMAQITSGDWRRVSP
ncbi:MAG TPA: gamma-glutamylcyclotransferase [Syntrophales bacterium]|nr:gamma-glutamylcyclotransferase [Syntrophales bacterium]HOM07300.1 gamma-glutamylcyclotransferase [Syntrophales bacterium]HOO00173.1 gamma-glutamylcyclotransferase [Syntrophales bacterium]HPC01318.1 gamma-glutamylcyclotransferase [Syntrophales bacterium]HPQ06855.1 gamma-glutamylcyclotransferase [Syntrophales bacterium]